MERRQLSEAYTGAFASDYDDRRSQSAKWLAETEAVRALLTDLPKGSSLLDVPVGTGRFLGLYREAGLDATGVDVSADMLREAAAKAIAGRGAVLVGASVFALPFANAAFETALCVRLLNWLDASDFCLALTELARVSRRYVLVGIRSKAGRPGLLGTFLGRRSAAGETTSRTIVHEKSLIARGFRDAGLASVRQSLVPHGQAGTDYVFYLLEKRA